MTAILALAFAQGGSAQTTTPKFEDPKQIAELVKAQYPLDLRLLGIGGTVRVSLRVTIPGMVDSVTVTNSSGIPSLDEAARTAARRFRFQKNERSFAVELPLKFQPDTVSALSYEQLPKLLNRSEVVTLAAQRLPPADRNPGIRVAVPVMVVVDSAGNVTRFEVVSSSCFNDFDDAALTGVKAMRFAAADNGGGALRRTVGTFEFAQPSARLRLPGEAAPPRGVATDSTENESNGEPGFGPSMAPRLANTEQVRAAMLGAYTSGMVDRKSTGTVGVWMLVDEQGFVVGRTVKTSSGQCRLDVAALEIASIMRFSPAMRNGKPMKVWVDMPLVFGSR